MELMFITLGGAIIGLAARYTLPHRHKHGAVLIPALGAATAGLLWEVLTWAGLKWNGGVIWWITLIATAVITVGVDLVVGAVRARRDEHLLSALSKGAVHPA
jgi:hypothetical protein